MIDFLRQAVVIELGFLVIWMSALWGSELYGRYAYLIRGLSGCCAVLFPLILLIYTLWKR